MPLLRVRKEVYEWLETGRKTIDVRRGRAQRGDTAVFQCGPHHLRLSIARRETGNLDEIVRQDNFKAIIPSAKSVEEALEYLESLYDSTEGLFTAYYLSCNSDEHLNSK
jgi:ASC-1-like (ASCH) protein